MRDWWSTWWQSDYSWEGLGALSPGDEPRHPWLGHFVDSSGSVFTEPAGGRRAATLQDYWRSECQDLIEAPDKSHWTRFHLPLEWRNGEATEKKNWGEAQLADLERRLSERLAYTSPLALTEHGFEGPDTRAQLQGAVLPVSLGGELVDDRGFLAHRVLFMVGERFSDVCIGSGTVFGECLFVKGVEFNNTRFPHSFTLKKCGSLGQMHFIHAKAASGFRLEEIAVLGELAILDSEVQEFWAYKLECEHLGLEKSTFQTKFQLAVMYEYLAIEYSPCHAEDARYR